MKNVFKLCIILLWIILQTKTSKAQSLPATGKISGSISDETGKPLDYATISLYKGPDSVLVRGMLSAIDGTFTFDKVPFGNYKVTVSAMGYQKGLIDKLNIDADHSALSGLHFQLRGTSRQLGTVNIVAQKPLVEQQIDKTVLNVENSSLAAGNSAMDILERAPGVSVSKDGNISLRGKQGVDVLIDGKRTYLSVEQLANLLKITEGNAIQSIELITNPSSKYDAAGNSGIINIRLKKNRAYGTNGSLTLGAGYGKYFKGNTGVTLNHREKTFNVFGSYNYANNKTYEDLDVTRLNILDNESTFFNQHSRSIRKSINNNYKAGVDFYLDKNNTLGLNVSGYVNNGSPMTINSTHIGNTPAALDSSVVANNPGKNSFKSISYNLNYKAVLDTLGQELSADLDYSSFNNSVKNYYQNVFLDAAGQNYKPDAIFRISAPTAIDVYAGKIDYTLPINAKTKLETGVKTSYVKTDNDFHFENLIAGNYLNDTARSNHFLYKENINAVYGNLSRQFKSTSIQVGLRLEQTNSKGNSITTSRIVNRHYLDFFPTLFINQVLSKNNTLGLSYSRRVDRPDYQSLNPFVYFIDLYTFQQGNPFLNPQYSNSFQLNYTYKKSLNIALGYSQTSNVITQVLLTDTVKKTLYQTTQNLANQKFYNINIYYPWIITNWWNASNNFTAYYNDFKSPNLLGAPYHSGKLAVQVNSLQNFTISPTISAEVSANYQSAQVYGTYRVKSMYGVDAGFSKSFADRKVNLKFAVNDVFNLRKTQISSAIPGQNYVLFEKPETRVFRLTFSYRFGSNDVKGPRNSSRGSESEENRIRKGN